MTKEILTRELEAIMTNTGAIAVPNSETFSNQDQFFNDTPWNLELVGIVLTATISEATDLGNVSQISHLQGTAEVSRQSTFGQQEGIVARGICGYHEVSKLTATSSGHFACQILQLNATMGDFKTTILTQEVETSLFLNGEIQNMLDSTLSIGAGLVNMYVNAILYYDLGSLRKR